MTIFRHGGKTTTGQVFSSKFIAKWDTTQPGSANDTVVLPLVADGSYNFYIDWGDGNRDTITGYNQPEVTHQYSDTGIYTIRVVSNNMVGWQFNDSGDDDKLTEIMEWGPLRFVSDDTNLFKGCSNLTLSTTSDPPFNADAAGMFQDCSSLTGTGGNILNWDMSAVTGMNFMLAGCTNLDADLSNWDVSSIENAEGFMSGAGLSMSNYDRILSGWSSQSVQSGVNISFGDTKYSHVTGASYRDILTSAATGWIIIDGGAHLPPNPKFIATWDTRNNNIYTNSGLSDTIILPLRSNGTYDFYVDWGDGTAQSHVTDYESSNARHTYTTPGIYTTIITGTLIGWAYYVNSSSMGNSRSDLQGWQTIQSNSPKLTCIHDWEALRFTDDARNQFYATFKLTGVPTEMFNVPLGGSIIGAFQGQQQSGLGIAITNNNMISGWDMSPVKDMTRLFSFMGYETALDVDFDVSNWDVSNVTGMERVFQQCQDWNNGGSPGISGWDTSNVLTMREMFDSTSFNQDIGAWDVSNVTNMRGMFEVLGVPEKYPKGNFNNGGSPSISGWDTSSVVDLSFIFAYNQAFDQPVGSWDTSSVQNMNYAFAEKNYSYDLAGWVVTGVTSATNFLGRNVGTVSSHRGMPTSSYSTTLISWGAQSVQNGVNITFGNSTYSAGAAATARQSLVNQGWTISDGGQA